MMTTTDVIQHLIRQDKTFDYTKIKIRFVPEPPYGVVLEGDSPLILFPSKEEDVLKFDDVFEKTKWYLVFPQDLNRLQEELKDKVLVIDIETNQLEMFAKSPRILSFGVAVNGTEEAYAIPTEEPFVDAETKIKNVEFCKNVLKNAKGIITHNGTLFDIPFISAVWGFNPFELFKKQKGDTLIIAHVLTGGGLDNYKLGYLVQKLVDSTVDFKEVVQDYLSSIERLKSKRTYDKIPIHLLLPYNRLDCFYTSKLYDNLMASCDKDMVKAINFVHKQIGYLCLRMLEDGIFLDYNMVSYLEDRIEEKKKAADEQARHFLDRIFKARNIEKDASQVNFNSSKQMVKVFFHDMGLPTFERSAKTNEPSTGVDSLLLLMPFEPSLILCQLLSQKWGTYGGYLKNYLEAVGRDNETGLPLCCHSQFNSSGTVTGRLASSKPNAQNITGEAQLKATFCSPDRSKMIYSIREKMEEYKKKKGNNRSKNETDL